MGWGVKSPNSYDKFSSVGAVSADGSNPSISLCFCFLDDANTTPGVNLFIWIHNLSYYCLGVPFSGSVFVLTAETPLFVVTESFDYALDLYSDIYHTKNSRMIPTYWFWRNIFKNLLNVSYRKHGQ